MFMELIGTSDGLSSMLRNIREIPGFRDAVTGDRRSELCPLLLIVDRPPHCKIGADSPLICLECPLSWGLERPVWKFVAPWQWDPGHTMPMVNREGVKAIILDVATFGTQRGLSDRQRDLLATARAKGFFEFPRRISLTKLSSAVGVKPWTLSRRLRDAEFIVARSIIQERTLVLQRETGSQRPDEAGDNSDVVAQGSNFEDFEKRPEEFIW